MYRHHVAALFLLFSLLAPGCTHAALPVVAAANPPAVSGQAPGLGLRVARLIDGATIRLTIGPSFVAVVGAMPEVYRVVSLTDTDFQPGVRAIKATVRDTAETAHSGWTGKKYDRHTVTLTLPKPMKIGQRYWVQVIGGGKYSQPVTGGRAAGWIETFTDAAEQGLATANGLGVRSLELIAPKVVQITTGDGLDTTRADGHPENIVLTCTDDPDFAGGRPAVKVGRRSRGEAFLTDGWPYGFFEKNEVFAIFDKPLKQGKTYVLDMNAVAPLTYGQSAARLTVDDHTAINPAIKVNQVGYLPGAKNKYVYFGDWMGSAGAIDLAAISPNFEVHDAKTNATALTGTWTVRHKSGDKNEGLYPADLSFENVAELDLSALIQPGSYYVAIPGAGRSFTFSVADNVYAEPYRVMMAGLYAQRCGIELKPPYANTYRPACHRNATQLTDLPRGSEGDAFANLEKHVIDPKKYDMFGGYHDAGDWDPHSHIQIAENAFLLYEAKPGAFYDGQSNIPESKNGVPDILDVGRWELDLWTRLQDADGGVHEGVEANGDPDEVTMPEEDKHREFAFAKSPGASLRYAAIGAQAAYLWGGLGKAADAKELLTHAVKAWDWAFAHGGEKQADAAARAAIQLYRATGDKKYLDAFNKYSVFANPNNTDLDQYGKYDQRDASFYYALCKRPVDADMKARIVKAFAAMSAEWTKWADTNAYRYLRHPYTPNTWGTGAHPKWLIPIIQAYVLTHDPNDLKWIQLTCDFALGCNPMNTVFTTGLGQRPITGPLHILNRYSPDGIPGIQSEGPSPQEGGQKAGSTMGSWIGAMLYPAGQWPELQTYSDVVMSPGMNEGVVVDQMATAVAYGFLLPERTDKH